MIKTVQELIDELQKVKNKNLPILTKDRFPILFVGEDCNSATLYESSEKIELQDERVDFRKFGCYSMDEWIYKYGPEHERRIMCTYLRGGA